jgi:orotidine-5'-phosphate decarboxylase
VIGAVREAGTPLVLGIDPREEEIPPAVRGDGKATWPMLLRRWSAELVDLAIAEKLPAIKVQVAFYEAAGGAGISAFNETLDRAREAGILAIADVKRGDMGSTAEAYARAFFGEKAHIRADAITASPYLGEDSIAALLKAAVADSAGIFALVRTSNPGARDLQELELKDGRRVHEAAADLVARLNEPTRDESGYGALGAVVGATAPEVAPRLRSRLPHSILLAPGVGAQGADPKALRPFFDAKGEGALVPVSRGISAAWRDRPEADWKDACCAAIRRLKAEIAAALA